VWEKVWWGEDSWSECECDEKDDGRLESCDVTIGALSFATETRWGRTGLSRLSGLRAKRAGSSSRKTIPPGEAKSLGHILVTR